MSDGGGHRSIGARSHAAQISINLVTLDPAIRFGAFELDRASGELRKDGAKLRVQGQPIRILEALIEARGALVTREELRARLWSDDTFVDFDNSLNNAVNRLRAALGDDAGSPKYIETVGRRGYRFIGTLAAGDRAPAAPMRTRLGVLPFRMLRNDDEIEFLTSSLPDALAASLSGLESLAVRSPIAARRFAAAEPDLAAISAALDVNLLLTGSILRSGNRVRITSQLVEVPSGRLLWTHTAETALNDLFALQDELARRIVESLSLPLSVREHQLLHHDVPSSGHAYEQYLRANRLAETATTWVAAKDSYLNVIREDPQYAPAWARLGRIYRLMWKYTSGDSRQWRALADESFRRALSLNPELSVAHHYYAQLEMETGRTREALVRLAERAREHPADPQIFAGLVQACRYAGLLDASLAAHERARRLDPNVATSVAYTLWALGDREQALETCGITAEPFRGLILVALGRLDEARTVLAGARELYSEYPLETLFIDAMYAALDGDREATGECIDALFRTDFSDPEGIYFAAVLSMWAGDFERAERSLVVASEKGFASLPQLESDPTLAPLASSPRYGRVRDEVEKRYRDAAAAFDAAGGSSVLLRAYQ